MPSEDDLQKVQSARKIIQNFRSADKRVRKQTYVDFERFLKNEEFSNQELRHIFTETQIHCLNGFRDKAEIVREQAIHFMHYLIIEKLPLNDFYLTYVFPVLVERIGSVELIEESEEIRLELVKFLQAIILKYSETEQLKPFVGDCTQILCESVKDKHPAVKELSAKCVIDLAEALPRDFHLQAESLVKPLVSCLGHQRYKVRVEALKAIGEVIMHSSYNALNDAVGPLAERLFDSIPIVRRTVAQIAARWLMEYKDRYSFFCKILPLLLTGLNDEVEETRIEAAELWVKVGLQFQQENEKDLKDQLDFLTEKPKHYPENLDRPNLGCRVLVQRNVCKLSKALSYELTSWQEDIRVRCSQLLCAIALHAEDGLTQNLQDLLPAMYSAANDQDQRVVQNIVRASELIGTFVPYASWTKLVIPAIENGVHAGQLIVLAALIEGAPQDDICKNLEDITKVLADESVSLTRKKPVQTALKTCTESIARKFKDSGNDVTYHLFKIAISILSLQDSENSFNLSILTPIQNVMKTDSVYSIWSLYLNRLLNDINSDPRSWTVVSPYRCIFQTILVECNEAFGENLNLIGDILVQTLDPECEPESRLKTYLALAMAFEKKDVIFKNAPNNIGEFFGQLIENVFVPSLVWHAGLTAEALRTMAVSCLLTALSPIRDVDLFRSEDNDLLRNLFDKLLPLLLSLVEDASWRSRQLSLETLSVLKSHMCAKQIWTYEDLLKIYPEVLKRLDDPSEKVRISALKILPNLLTDSPLEFRENSFRSHHELIVDTLLTHFDDDDEGVQEMVTDVIKVVALINRNEVLNKVERHKPLLRNKKGCMNILNYLETM